MLLNISNHPKSSWGVDQLSYAENLCGSVQDYPFPVIDPNWDNHQIHAMADTFATEILKLKPSAVHIMGEMTFCFCLVNLLKHAGIPCYASTTQRIVNEEGKYKSSLFEFVRFREY